MIKKGDRVRHIYDGFTGTVATDEINDSVTVKQDIGGVVTVWAAGDTEVIDTSSI